MRRQPSSIVKDALDQLDVWCDVRLSDPRLAYGFQVLADGANESHAAQVLGNHAERLVNILVCVCPTGIMESSTSST